MSSLLALGEAIATDDVAAVERLIAAEPTLLTERGPQGESLILAAAYRRAVKVVDALRAHLPALNAWEAAAVGDLAALDAALASAPDAVKQYSRDGWTPLHLAAFFGQTGAIVRLIEAGSLPNALSTNGMANTPLHAALAGEADAPVIEALIAAGADVRAVAAEGVTPLHLAASRGEAAIAERLLALGGDPAAQTSEGQMPSHLAASRGHLDLAGRLARAV